MHQKVTIGFHCAVGYYLSLLNIYFTFFRNQGVLTFKPKTALNHGEDKQLYYTLECGKHKATVSFLTRGQGWKNILFSAP